MAVSWSAPVTDGGSAITGYKVTAAPGGSACTATVLPTCKVGHLTNGRPYRFTVRALNRYGFSAASVVSASVVPATTPAVPKRTKLVVLTSTFTLSWTAPKDNGGATISKYVVTVTKVGAHKGRTLSVSKRVIQVTKLSGKTKYVITLAGANVMGAGKKLVLHITTK